MSQFARDAFEAVQGRDMDRLLDLLGDRIAEGHQTLLSKEALAVLLIETSREVDEVHNKQSMPHIHREAAVVVSAMLRTAAVRLVESIA